mgnify:CR=1 FL=1
MNKPMLWVLVGLSGSGKSTIAAQIAENNPNTIIVSSDTIRKELTGSVGDQSQNEEVFKFFYDRIRRGLEKKKNVVADATNLTMKSRRIIMDKVNGLDIHKICYIIPKPFEQCKRDNLNRQCPVPNRVLDRQIRRFQIPFLEEGFEQIGIYSFEKENPLTIMDMFNLMRDFDQKNPHHNKPLDEHCAYTQNLFSEYRYWNAYDLGAILHDFGKLFTQTIDEDGIAHYYDHPSVGSYLVLENLNGCEEKILLAMCFLINYHMMPFEWSSDKAKEKWRNRFGKTKYQMLLDFNECDKTR